MKTFTTYILLFFGLYSYAQVPNDTIYTQPITATKAFDGNFGSAMLQIDDAGDDGEITRPLIVAEGFDSGLDGQENEFGEDDISSFVRSVNRANSGNLETLLTGGTDVDFQTGDQDYDIIYVNWDNPRAHLQLNAFVLEEVITWVNQEKEDAGSLEQNVVLGQSMGGVLARYALVNMEDDPDLDHDTNLYISHDAPHQGANIPIGIQYFARHIANEFIDTPASGAEISVGDGGSASIEEINNLFNQPGTQQLLSTYVDSSLNIDNDEFDDWQTELQSKGYPSQTRNIAISNGSFCGYPQDYDYNASLFKVDGKANSGLIVDVLALLFGKVDDVALAVLFEEPALLLGILPGGNEYDINFNSKALPQANSSANVYNGSIKYTKTILWTIPITTTITELSADAYANLSFDVYPGGRNEFFDSLDDIIYFDDIDYGDDDEADYTQFQADMLNFFAGSTEINFENEDTFGFIPSVSALDVGGGDGNLEDDDYFKVYSAANPPTDDLNIPFDNYTSTINDNGQNERHISFNTRNGDWLADELEAESPADYPVVEDCGWACDNGNFGIIGTDQFCTGNRTFSVPSGADSYQWQLFSDPIPMNDDPLNGNVSIVSATNTNSITISHTGNMSGWYDLRVTINSDGCDVEHLILTKQIYIGAPTVDSIAVSADPSGAHLNPAQTPFSCEVPLRLDFAPNNIGITDIEWEKVTTDVEWSRDFMDYSGRYVYLFPDCNKEFEFRVRAKNDCGFWSPWRELSYDITECSTTCQAPVGSIESDNFYLHPVPANNVLNFNVQPDNTWDFPSSSPFVNLNDITADHTIDSSGQITYPKVSLFVSFYNGVGVLQHSTIIKGLPNQIDVSSLQNGNYIMTVEYLGQIETHNIQIY